MEEECSYTDKNIEFGRTSDTPTISHIVGIDIDKQIIKIPFVNSLTHISDLIATYLNITSHRSKFEGKPALRVLKGKYKRSIAQENKPLLWFNFSSQDICFRVEDSSHLQNDFTDVQQYLSEPSQVAVNEEDLVQIVLALQGRKIKHTVSKKLNVLSLKENIIKSIPELKKMNTEAVILQMAGSLLSNDRKIEQLNIYEKEIKIFIKKTEGCYKGNTLIMLPDRTQKEISKLKIGDLILTFNRKTRQVQESKVTSVYESIMSQSTVIKLSNGYEIQTTPNHLFLCEDYSFRLVKGRDAKEESLRQGDVLRLYNKKIVQVVSIQSKLIPHETFYRVESENDKNLIINHGVISHHYSIKVRSPDGLVQSIDISPFDTFRLIKEKLEKIYHLNVVNQRLMYCFKELNDQHTIRDRQIPNEATLNLNKKSFNKVFGLLGPDTMILSNNKSVKVSQFKRNDYITCVSCRSCELRKEKDKIIDIVKVDVQKVIVFTFRQNTLTVNPDTYILVDKGEAILASALYKNYFTKSPNLWPKLLGINKKPISISRMQLVSKNQKMYKIITDAPNFISNEAIIPNSIVTCLLDGIQAGSQRISLNCSKKMQISSIRERIEKITQIELKPCQFFFNGEVVFNDDNITQKGIQNEHVLILREKKKAYYQSTMFGDQEEEETLETKNVTFQFVKGPKYCLKYTLFKNQVIRDLLKEYMHTEDPSYFLLFAEIIIFSNQKLSKMQQSLSFMSPNSTILVIKNEKLSFVSALSLPVESIKNSSCIFFEDQAELAKMPTQSKIAVPASLQLKTKLSLVSSQIEKRQSQAQLKSQHFYLPFLYFSSQKYHKQIYEYTRHFEEHRAQINKEDSVFTIIKDLYCNMNLLPNYLKRCYYGIRNFRATQFFTSGQSFYWHNFTLAYKDKQNVRSELKNHSGTLFRIQSTSGKDISAFTMDPQKNQILFAPFTYFLIENTLPGETLDQVWLTQIAAPITFKKDIILWVDDNPQGNQKDYNQILKWKPDLQILQVTSTTAAEKWIIQFGWILNWKGLEFKLISDMGRKEWKGDQQQENKQAGIDLLELLYKIKGYSAQTLIFCGNQPRAQQIATQRKIPQERYLITTNQKALYRYVGINLYDSIKA